MKQLAFMFPGQGSQTVGMGKEIHDHFSAVQQMYEKANVVLHKDLRSIMFTGPKEVLTETENAQPALLLSSIAIYHLLTKENIQPAMTIGHSLGEYSALVACGALQLNEALPLVATRGKLMEEAFPKGQGTMAAVLGMEREIIEGVLATITHEIVDIANINCPGQIVISGSKEGIEVATKLLKENGAKRIIPLNVSGPFHSRLMKAANEKFATYLNQVQINDAQIPNYANVTAEPVTDRDTIQDLLLQQLYSPVRFEESIQNMINDGVDVFVEIGNGKVLTGLVRKINRNVQTFSIQDLTSLNDFITWYKGE